MKTLTKWIFTVFILIVNKVSVWALSPEPSMNTYEPTMYEKLGVSSTTLFSIMLGVTILLVVVVMALAGVIRRLIEAEREKLEKLSKLLVLGFLFFYSSTANAATTDAGESWVSFSDTSFWVFIGMDVVLILLIFYFRSLINSFMPEGIRKESFLPWKRVAKTFTGEVIEIENEKSILMDHEYDGIHELDNNLPPWWKYGFYITIVWAVVYFGYYQVFGIGLNQEEEFLSEMAAGEAEVEAYKAAHPELINAENVELLTDASAISQGKEVFETYCVSCHAEQGIGGIGPNLTDKYWIYDGDIKGVFTSVSEGRSNGMVAWKEFISPDKIQLVASYVLSLEEVNAPAGKEPQGENIFE